MMTWLILTLLLGLNLAPFLFLKLPIWLAQGLFAQGMLLIIFSCSFFTEGRSVKVKNVFLGLFNLWFGLLTGWLCYKSQLTARYNIANFLPYFNFLCLLIFYQMVVKYLDAKNISLILTYLRGCILFTLFVCVLQYFGLSQFFTLLKPEEKYYNNIVTGFLGNGVHLSDFLGSCAPLFLITKSRENYLALALMLVVMMFLGTNTEDISLSGYIVFTATVLYVSFFQNRKLFFWILGLLTVSAGTVYYFFHNSLFFSLNGRLGVWEVYWNLFLKSPVAGYGAGMVNMIYYNYHLPIRLLHLEYFQAAVELGITGLVLILLLIDRFFREKIQASEGLFLKALVFGFLVSCCFTYPAHLWLPATWAMFFYAACYAIKNNEEKSLVRAL